MRRFLPGLPFLLLSSLFTGCGGEVPPDTLLAVFAHPDDETTVGPVLAEYAARGATVHLVTATDGRLGRTDHFGMEVGDDLVEVRKKELACSCRALGIEAPIQLRAEDQFGMAEGIGEVFGQMHGVEADLLRVIDSLRPEVILTFGPDGESGHPDHRLISNILSQVVFSGKLDYAPRLYYWGYTKAQMEKYSQWETAYVDEDYLDTRIPYGEAALERHFASIRCYASQFSPQMMETWIGEDRADDDHRLFFRRAWRAAGAKEEF